MNNINVLESFAVRLARGEDVKLFLTELFKEYTPTREAVFEMIAFDLRHHRGSGSTIQRVTDLPPVDIEVLKEAVQEMIKFYEKPNLLDSSLTKPTKKFIKTLPMLFEDQRSLAKVKEITTIFEEHGWKDNRFLSPPNREKIAMSLHNFIHC